MLNVRWVGSPQLHNKDVIATVFDLDRWSRTDQLIAICKPLVDIIGDVESRDATLADCMLQLIWAHREVNRVPHREGHDPGFAAHAKEVLNAQFHAMNTDVHWFALFLHPLCRKLAISSVAHSRSIDSAYRIALGIVQRWGWMKTMAQNTLKDIKAYHLGEAPFIGGKADGKDWWNSLIAPIASHPLKALAIKIFSIVPHAAEVERFFSCLRGVQSKKQSRLTVSHMQTFGTLRNQYTYEIHQAALASGKSTHRKHAHMHTRAEPGIDISRAEDLLKTFVWTPLDDGVPVEPELIRVVICSMTGDFLVLHSNCSDNVLLPFMFLQSPGRHVVGHQGPLSQDGYLGIISLRQPDLILTRCFFSFLIPIPFFCSSNYPPCNSVLVQGLTMSFFVARRLCILSISHPCFSSLSLFLHL